MKIVAQNVPLTVIQTRGVASVIQKRDVKIWFELNAPHWTLGDLYKGIDYPLPGPPDRTLLEHAVVVLKALQPIMSSAVVTSKKGTLEIVYSTLKKEVPGVRVIGGLKMWPYMPDGMGYPNYGVDVGYDWLADVEIWEQFEKDARRVVELTGTKHVVIMAEGPMRPFYAGIRRNGVQTYYHPDYKKFSVSMQPLMRLAKDQIHVRLYPFGTNRGRTVEDGVELIKAIRQAVPSSWFVLVGDGWPTNEDNQDLNTRRDAMRKACSDRVAHHLFVTSDGVWRWSNGRSRECHSPLMFQHWLIRRSFSQQVWMYPGFFSALGVCEALHEMLIAPTFRPSAPPVTDSVTELGPSNELERTTVGG